LASICRSGSSPDKPEIMLMPANSGTSRTRNPINPFEIYAGSSWEPPPRTGGGLSGAAMWTSLFVERNCSGNAGCVSRFRPHPARIATTHVSQMIDAGISEPMATSIIRPSCGLRDTSPFTASLALSVKVDIRICPCSGCAKLAASGSDPKFSATSVRSSSCCLTKSSKSPAAAIGR